MNEDIGIKARREYMKEYMKNYRKNNKEKIKEINMRYWNNKAQRCNINT